MKLIYNKIEPKILEKLKDISKSIIFDKYKDLNEILAHNKCEEETLKTVKQLIFSLSDYYPPKNFQNLIKKMLT